MLHREKLSKRKSSSTEMAGNELFYEIFAWFSSLGSHMGEQTRAQGPFLFFVFGLSAHEGTSIVKYLRILYHMGRHFVEMFAGFFGPEQKAWAGIAPGP